MRLSAVWKCRIVCVAIIACACRQESAGASDKDAGARLSVFVPTADVTLAQQQYSGMNTRERVLVRSADEWAAIWARMHAGQEPSPSVVQPDFSTEMAVVAAMGKESTGGFDIVIDSVTVHERGVVVYVTEKSPGANCMTTDALTQPVHAVRAPKTDGSVWWRERTAVENC